MTQLRSQFAKRRCHSREGSRGDTTPVGACLYRLPAMAGNVWEWT